MSIDFVNDQCDLYINGKANMTYLYRKNRKFIEKFSDNKDLPMVIRLGHYYFDNKPIIGTILDFHVWDRYLIRFTEPKIFYDFSFCILISLHQNSIKCFLDRLAAKNCLSTQTVQNLQASLETS